LRDRASAWFHSLQIGSITSWDEMRKVFLSRFFPRSKTAQLRNQITQFTQRDGESLYDAWERFKEMLRLCPDHGLDKWLIIHTTLLNQFEHMPFYLEFLFILCAKFLPFLMLIHEAKTFENSFKIFFMFFLKEQKLQTYYL